MHFRFDAPMINVRRKTQLPSSCLTWGAVSHTTALERVLVHETNQPRVLSPSENVEGARDACVPTGVLCVA